MEPLPLADLHRRLGARFEDYLGTPSPAVYSTEEAEHAALLKGCGLLHRWWTQRLEMRGEDRVRFLHGLTSCDVKALEPGDGTYGFVTDIKGKVLADIAVLALGDRLWLELPMGTAEAVAAHLAKYALVDRVEIVPLAGVAPLTLAGPRAAEVLGGEEALPKEARGHWQITVGGSEVLAVAEPGLGVPAWTLWAPSEAAVGVAEALLERGAAAVGHRAWERLRVEQGRPLFGRDFSREHFPQETGLEEEAVSYTKGCYLGQEIIARIHYRGGVNRQLHGLVFTGPAPADVPREILHDGRAAGSVTSAVTTSAGAIGLAIVHKRVEPGTTVELAGGGTAEVVELPFARLG